MPLLKKIASQLPPQWQTEMKRIYFSRQIKRNSFVTDEPEYKILHDLISQGDWVVDVGANVGHYTKRFSELVGVHGRVFAFEPVPTTFSLLSANTQLFRYPNVTLINAAVSDKLDVVGMSIPKFSTGLTNYYQAHLSSVKDSALSVLTLSIDSLNIGRRVTLIKIDAEGHEAFVLAGMKKLIKKHHPTLIIENPSQDINTNLASFGYVSEVLPGSPNVVFKQEHLMKIPSSKVNSIC